MRLRIGILSKRTGYFTGKLKNFFESKGHNTIIYTKENLCLNESMLENDLYILKSKHQIPFVYAGFYAESHGIPVIPNSDISQKHKDRFEAYLLIKNAGLLYPKWYYGTPQTIKKNLKDKDFPLILKPVSGSGSIGVKIIYNFSDIENLNQDILYLEKYIEGKHYTVYFIGDKICSMEKIPLTNEHSEMTRRELSKEIKQIIMKWKNQYNLLFGHLDIVVEKKTNKHLVVDTGSFPEFSNWKCGGDPVSLIGNLILKEYKKLKN